MQLAPKPQQQTPLKTKPATVMSWFNTSQNRTGYCATIRLSRTLSLHTLHDYVHPKQKHIKTRNACTRVGTLIVATIYLQQIQNRYMFRSFTVLQCSHQHCVQPVASDVEVVGYL